MIVIFIVDFKVLLFEILVYTCRKTCASHLEKLDPVILFIV